MADRVVTLAKAQKELEDMYSGVPDESVNLTFGDLVEVKPGPLARKLSGPLEKKFSDPLETINENKPINKNNLVAPVLSSLPSLDFSRGLEAAAKDNRCVTSANHPAVGHPFANKHRGSPLHENPRQQQSPYRVSPLHDNPQQRSPYNGGTNSIRAYADTSMGALPGMSICHDGEKGRRPGIPHSNICTICSNYIYMCKHRCLVCGRAYCKNCGEIGMGEMTEGRKCLECLGKKFSRRYIPRAGQISCCMRFKYSSDVIQQELKWAEKGPRKTEKRYGQSAIVSIARSPMTPTRHNPNQSSSSFVMGSPYSPYNSSPISHPLPF